MPEGFGDLSNLETLNLLGCSKLELLPASQSRHSESFYFLIFVLRRLWTVVVYDQRCFCMLRAALSALSTWFLPGSDTEPATTPRQGRGQVWGKGTEYAGTCTGRHEVHHAALIFTACAVRTHMRKIGAAACPVEGETEARRQTSMPFSL